MLAGHPVNTNTTKPTLVFTWGNPSRGDDAIGPEIYRLLTDRKPEQVDVLTDFQLQIEHTQDLLDRQRVIFVDASMTCPEPYEYTSIQPDHDMSFTTHAMSPCALLWLFQSAYRLPVPDSCLLTVRGYQFDLGKPISERAYKNMLQSIDHLEAVIRQNH